MFTRSRESRGERSVPGEGANSACNLAVRRVFKVRRILNSQFFQLISVFHALYPPRLLSAEFPSSLDPRGPVVVAYETAAVRLIVDLN